MDNQQGPADLEERLGLNIHDVSRLRRCAFDRSLKPLNVTRSQCAVLSHLARRDGMTQSELAQEMGMGKVAVGGLIDRLEKADLVRRSANPQDRRVNRIFLQSKAEHLIAQLSRINHRINEQILSGLPGDKLEIAAATLLAIKRNLLDLLKASAQ